MGVKGGAGRGREPSGISHTGREDETDPVRLREFVAEAMRETTSQQGRRRWESRGHQLPSTTGVQPAAARDLIGVALAEELKARDTVVK